MSIFKKILTGAAAALLAFSCSNPVQAPEITAPEVSEKAVIDLATINEWNLGFGYDIIKDNAQGRPYDDTTMVGTSDTKSRQIKVDYKFIESNAMLQDYLKISVDIEGAKSFGTFDLMGGANLDLFNETEITENNIMLLIRVSYEDLEYILNEGEYKESANTILSTQGIDSFTDRYGDCFLKSVTTGANFYMSFTASTQSQRTKEELKASIGFMLKDWFGDYFTMTASYDASKVIQNENVTIEFHMSSDITQLPPHLTVSSKEEFNQNVEHFKNYINGGGALKTITSKYEKYPSIPDDFFHDLEVLQDNKALKYDLYAKVQALNEKLNKTADDNQMLSDAIDAYNEVDNQIDTMQALGDITVINSAPYSTILAYTVYPPPATATPTPSVTPTPTPTPGSESGAIGTARKILMGDINGDNKLDMVTIGKENTSEAGWVRTALSDGNNFTYWDYSSDIRKIDDVSNCKVFLTDVNGDNKDDLVGIATEGYWNAGYVYVALSNGVGFDFWTYNTGVRVIADVTNSKIYLEDINGDLKTDLVTIAPEGLSNAGYVYAALSTGSGFDFWTFATTVKTIDYVASSKIYFPDVNGDGKADLVTVAPEQHGNAGYVYTALSTGSGFTFWSSITSGRVIDYVTDSKIYFPDFNGDGKDDIIAVAPEQHGYAGRVYCGLSNGSGFNYWTGYSVTGIIDDIPNARLFIEDVNGDGKDDIVGIATEALSNSGYVYVALGNDTGFTFWSGDSQGAWIVKPNSARIYFGDVNGDSKSDLIAVGVEGAADEGVIYVGKSTGSMFNFWSSDSN